MESISFLDIDQVRLVLFGPRYISTQLFKNLSLEDSAKAIRKAVKATGAKKVEVKLGFCRDASDLMRVVDGIVGHMTVRFDIDVDCNCYTQLPSPWPALRRVRLEGCYNGERVSIAEPLLSGALDKVEVVVYELGAKPAKEMLLRRAVPINDLFVGAYLEDIDLTIARQSRVQTLRTSRISESLSDADPLPCLTAVNICFLDQRLPRAFANVGFLEIQSTIGAYELYAMFVYTDYFPLLYRFVADIHWKKEDEGDLPNAHGIGRGLAALLKRPLVEFRLSAVPDAVIGQVIAALGESKCERIQLPYWQMGSNCRAICEQMIRNTVTTTLVHSFSAMTDADQRAFYNLLCKNRTLRTVMCAGTLNRDVAFDVLRRGLNTTLESIDHQGMDLTVECEGFAERLEAKKRCRRAWSAAAVSIAAIRANSRHALRDCVLRPDALGAILAFDQNNARGVVRWLETRFAVAEVAREPMQVVPVARPRRRRFEH